LTGATASGPPALPPGTFRIDRDGAWRHEGQEVTHPAVLRNLFANLRADRDGHYLQIGPARVAVQVDDTPFVVLRVEPASGVAEVSPGIRAWLSDGSEESMAADSLWIGPRDTPYCRVKGGAFTARLALPAWLQLARLAEEDPESGELHLVIGGRRIPVPRRG
jgi:hypothetical protein